MASAPTAAEQAAIGCASLGSAPKNRLKSSWSIVWIRIEPTNASSSVRVGSFPFTASGKAVASAHTAGFAKIIAEPKYGEIVGAHLVGAGATELIAEIGLAMTLESTTAEIAATTHAHPTLSEALHEAALLAEGRGINF